MISRRAFLMGGVILGGAFMADGLLVEPKRIRVERVDVPVEGLGPGFDGYTICQVTDIHHSPIVSRSYIEGVVETAAALKPDMVAFTGDYIDEDREYMAPAIEALSRLRGGHATMAVLGNHDYFIDWRYSADVIRSHGLDLLLNDHRVLERGASRLCVGGTRDYFEDRPDARAAFEGAPDDVPRVLLCHHPDYAEYLPGDVRVDLVLSGHTHGGQVRIPFTGLAPVVPSNFGQKYAGGLVELNRATGPGLKAPTRVYVSRGVGVVLLPVRFSCPPELTLIRLVAA